MSAAICGWRHLRYLAAGALSTSGLVHVATLPTLKRLLIRAEEKMQLPMEWDSPTFAVLEALELCDLSARQNLLQDLFLTPIRFWVEGAYQCHMRHLLRASLRSPEIEDHMYRDPAATDSHKDDLIIKTEHILPFLSFALLTIVNLYSRYSFDLDDSMHGRTPRTTLAGLRALARHCKHLERLSLAFDARVVKANTGRRVYGDRLARLDVVGSPLIEPCAGCGIPFRHFSRLLLITNCDRQINWEDLDDEEPESEFSRKWTEVESLVTIFAEVRAQEGVRMNAGDSESDW
ncbi:hypothetical protein Hypma_016401 [Hypsizygus marmoreus]|uniref:F-box domain-containing protein n=1 Tax=Hypsizygus marmoreus TaxID=39966 RepID=A0A369J4U3_HYPMA|nr:hypothetical protein Hypma_016401 [Hypsizygus marmoreus]